MIMLDIVLMRRYIDKQLYSLICNIKYIVGKWRNGHNNREAPTRGVLWKKVFLEISQNSQENTCARVSFLIKSLF